MESHEQRKDLKKDEHYSVVQKFTLKQGEKKFGTRATDAALKGNETDRSESSF